MAPLLAVHFRDVFTSFSPEIGAMCAQFVICEFLIAGEMIFESRSTAAGFGLPPRATTTMITAAMTTTAAEIPTISPVRPRRLPGGGDAGCPPVYGYPP